MEEKTIENICSESCSFILEINGAGLKGCYLPENVYDAFLSHDSPMNLLLGIIYYLNENLTDLFLRLLKRNKLARLMNSFAMILFEIMEGKNKMLN